MFGGTIWIFTGVNKDGLSLFGKVPQSARSKKDKLPAMAKSAIDSLNNGDCYICVVQPKSGMAISVDIVWADESIARCEFNVTVGDVSRKLHLDTDQLVDFIVDYFDCD